MNTISSLSRVLSVEMPFEERLTTSVQITLIGMATIFLVLAILWGAIALLKIIIHDIPRKKKAEKATMEAVNSEPSPVSAPESKEEDNGALIAVITAAIAATIEQEKPGTGFRVVSFRRADRKGSWQRK